MNRPLSSLLLIAALLLLIVAIWVERREPITWQLRLALPFFTQEPNRHSPQHASGTFLPPIIPNDLELTPADNPVLLTNTTRIPVGVTVTIAPGTNIFAHEFGQLLVAGQLLINGSQTQPVTLTSNEQHPENRVWSGIIFQAGSLGKITYAIFRHASPAVSCLADSQVTTQNSQIAIAATGIFSASTQCKIQDSQIIRVENGVVAVAVNPQIFNTSITAKQNEVLQLPSP